MTKDQQSVPQERYIRHKLYSGDQSTLRRYAQLVVADGSLWTLLKYELITTLFGEIPGGLGLFLRKAFYPTLFRKTGQGVVFGKGLTIRNPQGVELGDRVLIDDDCLIDARGAGPEGIVIGEETLIHRGATIQAKAGPIRIGSATDIGAGCTIATQGAAIHVGDMVSIGGATKIGGGSIRLGPGRTESDATGSARNDFEVRGQERVSKGPIRIGNQCVFGMNVIVLDGTVIGAGTFVGTAALIREDVPAGSVVMPHQKLVVVPREQFAEGPASAALSAEAPDPDLRASGAPQPTAPEPVESSPGSRPGILSPNGATPIARTVFRALDQLNEQLPPTRHIEKNLAAPLLEPAGPLDSLGLINLVVALEEAVAEDHGVRVTLIDSVSAGARRGSFETVGSLVEHVLTLVAR
jgi:acetyltransferase-like isoleucine patch superfamily enzyme